VGGGGGGGGGRGGGWGAGVRKTSGVSKKTMQNTVTGTKKRSYGTFHGEQLDTLHQSIKRISRRSMNFQKKKQSGRRIIEKTCEWNY